MTRQPWPALAAIAMWVFFIYGALWWSVSIGSRKEELKLLRPVRAWTVKRDSPAPKAAGEIHSDIERGFIRAEIMKHDDLMRLGSEAAVKEKGLLHIEGKEYLIQDGDVVFFRFNV